MNKQEKALAEAIRCLNAARYALYAVAGAYDDAAGEKILTGNGVPPIEMRRTDAIDAVVFGMHEGEMHAHARTIASITQHLRSLHKTEARRI